MKRLLPLVLLFGLAACKKSTPIVDAGSEVGPPVSADAAMAAATDAATDAESEPMTPQDLANDHRDEMEKAANEGRYADVCAGTPAFPLAMCAWVAARAQGKPASKPDPSVSHSWFQREHIKKVSGTIVGDGELKGEYEAIVYGYRRHCVLSTLTTEFKTRGAFSLWVQELPDVRDVTVKSGDTEKWVELEENDLGKDIVDLAHAYGVEAEGMAKDLMVEIARFVPYAELKGDFPDAGAPPAATGTATATTTATTTATAAGAGGKARTAEDLLAEMAGSAPTQAAPPPPVQPTVDPEAKAKARSDCMKSCVSGCKDDAPCEMTCATKTCPK
ncbi:MAG TPA: hypothetical protein VF316_00365 [Polyangiaceae bacterium]